MTEIPAPVDPDALAAATQRFATLRRRYWWSIGGGLIWFATLGLPLIFLGDHIHSAIQPVAAFVFAIGFLIFWSTAVASWFYLLGFRCPRCGKRFMFSRSNTLATDRCKHCGLHLGLDKPGFLSAVEETFKRYR